MGFGTRDIEEALLARRWEIDCVDITLTQNDTPDPRSYRGKGFLRQDAEGVVGFRLYPPSPGEPAGAWDGFSKGSADAGKIVPGNEYYTLSATDWYGRIWKCQRVQPEVSITYCGAQPHWLIAGKAFDLKAEEKSGHSADAYLLRIVWGVDLELPFTTGTETVIKLGDKEVRSGSLNAAIFDTAFGKFTIRTEPGRLVLEFEADTPPQHHFFVRVRASRVSGFRASEWRHVCRGSLLFAARRAGQETACRTVATACPVASLSPSQNGCPALTL
jgi:hypothetical protein